MLTSGDLEKIGVSAPLVPNYGFKILIIWKSVLYIFYYWEGIVIETSVSNLRI